MILMYFAIIALSVTQSACVKEFNKECDSPIRFNALKTCAACALLILLFGWKCAFHPQSILFGALYGLSLSVSLYSGYKALSCGPLSLTSMTVSFSVIIPIAYGIVMCDEKVSTYRLIGFILLAVTILLNKLGKDSADTAKGKKWWLYVWITFFSNGFCSVLQKAHQIRFPGKYTAEFMITASVVSLAVCLTVFLLKKQGETAKTSLRSNAVGVLAGVSNTLGNYYSICLAGYRDASLLFPLISIGTILGALICGILRYRERPKPITVAAIIIGIASVVFLKLS